METGVHSLLQPNCHHQTNFSQSLICLFYIRYLMKEKADLNEQNKLI